MSEPDVSQLLTVRQAIEILDATPVSPRTVTVALSDADGLVLAEDLSADRDYPPFDKSQMDGYAVRCADLSTVPVTLHVVGEIAAGQTAARGLAAGEAMAIMTGAPLPPGADCVVPVEDVERDNEATVRVLKPTKVGRYIARRGSDVGRGVTVLPLGTRLGPAQIAVAASVGAAHVRVVAPPRVAVLSTGDEIVPVDAGPGPVQIRNSNTPMLVSLLRRLGCDVTELGVVRDEVAPLRQALSDGLRFDALFVTGGMSMGEYDFVPKVLPELGVELKITKVRIKPGKPFVFGVRRIELRHEGTEARRHEGVIEGERHGAGSDTLAPSLPRPDSVPSCLRASVPASSYVFGLPGNPVSGFVCTLRLASRLVRRMGGMDPDGVWRTGTLAEALPENGPREFYQPVTMGTDGRVVPLGWKGSADVYTLARADGFLVRAENEPALPAGAAVRVLEIPS